MDKLEEIIVNQAEQIKELYEENKKLKEIKENYEWLVKEGYNKYFADEAVRCENCGERLLEDDAFSGYELFGMETLCEDCFTCLKDDRL